MERAKKTGEEAHVIIAGDFNEEIKGFESFVAQKGFKIAFPIIGEPLKGQLT